MSLAARVVRPRRAAVALAAAAAALASVMSATAADVPVTATVSPGTLSVSSSATPSLSLTLNGFDRLPTYTAPLQANDETGSGNGWNLTVTSTQFSTGGATPHTLSATASAVMSVTAECGKGTCTNPTNGTLYPVVVPAGVTPPTPVKFFNPAANTGMGDFNVTPTVRVSIPANAYAGSYSSTLTVAVVSGP
jgi:hypothetical protein